MRNNRRVKYKGKASEILASITYKEYEIKVLRHGNTGHVLYRAPRLEDLEPCWFMDLETAKKGIHKLLNENVTAELNPLESDLESCSKESDNIGTATHDELVR